jgi:phosphatidylinositol-3-phosphatase
MENKAQTLIYGDMVNANYINTKLLVAYAHTTNFGDELPALDSEPHYVWMESGTNKFTDRTFTSDNDPSTSNSTKSTAHLVTQLDTAGISWTSYQEGIGTDCPVSSIPANFYAAKHDPVVFFQDVSGSPPSSANARCASHHKPLTALTTDLQNKTVATYNFVTPNLCHDMHGDALCPQGVSDGPNIKAGDDWLKANLQPIIDYALAHNGYVFITWDEGDSTNLMPFIAIGKNVIAGRPGGVAYTHSSLLKSEEEILGVPVLPSVMGASDFGDLFTAFP